jgi:hypothetical protein
MRPRPTALGETCTHYANASICVSSVLAPQYGFTYGPENLFDGRLDTAWVAAGAARDGIGEWIVVTFDSPQVVQTISLLNGYHKNVSLFERNNRVKDIEVRLSDGTQTYYTLRDGPDVQTLNVGDLRPNSWVQLITRSVYPGTKYHDTAITELRW